MAEAMGPAGPICPFFSRLYLDRRCGALHVVVLRPRDRHLLGDCVQDSPKPHLLVNIMVFRGHPSTIISRAAPTEPIPSESELTESEQGERQKRTDFANLLRLPGGRGSAASEASGGAWSALHTPPQVPPAPLRRPERRAVVSGACSKCWSRKQPFALTLRGCSHASLC